MEKIIANNFTLNAVVNGITIYCSIKMENSVGLFQFLDKDTGNLTPNWADDNGAGPMFHAEGKGSDGTSFVVDSPELWYNNTKVNFSNGLSTNLLTAGFVKKTVDSSGVTHYQFVKNVFNNASNADNDQFYITGQVKVDGGNTQAVQSETETISCIKVAAGGNTYYVKLDCTDIDKDGTAGKAVAHVFSSQAGTEVSDGLAYAWYNYASGKAVQMSGQSTKTLTVGRDDVNGDGLFECRVTIGGKTYSGFGNIHDFSDPWHLVAYEASAFETSVTDNNHLSRHIKKGETVTYNAKIENDQGEEQTNTGYTPSFIVKKSKDGTLFDASKPSYANTFSVSYASVINAGGELLLNLFAKKNA